MTYYVIEDKEHKEPDRLVYAPNVAQAIRHVAKRYSAKAADAHKVATMLQAGAKVENAGAEPAAE